MPIAELGSFSQAERGAQLTQRTVMKNVLCCTESLPSVTLQATLEILPDQDKRKTLCLQRSWRHLLACRTAMLAAIQYACKAL